MRCVSVPAMASRGRGVQASGVVLPDAVRQGKEAVILCLLLSLHLKGIF